MNLFHGSGDSRRRIIDWMDVGFFFILEALWVGETTFYVRVKTPALEEKKFHQFQEPTGDIFCTFVLFLSLVIGQRVGRLFYKVFAPLHTQIRTWN